MYSSVRQSSSAVFQVPRAARLMFPPLSDRYHCLRQRSILVTTENTMKPTIYAPFLSLVALAACNNLYSPINSAPPGPSFAVIRAQGDSLTVADTLNKFRAALGGSLNAPTSPPTDSRRRETTWA